MFSLKHLYTFSISKYILASCKTEDKLHTVISSHVNCAKATYLYHKRMANGSTSSDVSLQYVSQLLDVLLVLEHT